MCSARGVSKLNDRITNIVISQKGLRCRLKSFLHYYFVLLYNIWHGTKEENNMSLYGLVKLCVFGLMALLGLVMVIAPKPCTKKELREDPEQVGKVRKSGVIIMICGVLLIVLNVFI